MTLPWVLLLLSCYHLSFPIPSNGNQIKNLEKLLSSRRSSSPPHPESWSITELDDDDHEKNNDFSSTYVGSQEGLKEADKIESLPGQPEGVDFDQYAGYVTVDENAGRALFYYFVESPKNSSIDPLVLWLNGGPGCSSFGYGAMEELGPFRVKSDGKTLYRNKYAWNNVANVLFLETPTGVGFSYSNTASDYSNVGDKKTAEDSYTFLINWLERFPQYKTRDFFIAGESYAGHFVPQLAYTILYKNKKSNLVTINLKGIAIGNAWMDDNTARKGTFDYYWTHALNSDETNAAIHKYCDFLTGNFSNVCDHYRMQSFGEVGRGYINEFNIYAPLCNSSAESSHLDSVEYFDPCSDYYVDSYLNLAEVQAALHAKATEWSACWFPRPRWTDSPTTILPTLKQLITKGIMVWLYSGDGDANVPVTTTRYAINALKVPVEKAWRPWYSGGEVGGYVIGYSGVTLVTVRGAGHDVPSYQPERALTMIASFLEAKFPPPLPSEE